MREPLPPLATVGIIGGGQLGRMLAWAAARLGYRTVILEPAADCPAAQLASRHIAAAYDSQAALEEFAALCDVVTYEFENVPVAAARQLAARVPVCPPPRALEVSQDRLVEKEFLNAIGLSTAGFRPVDSVDDLADALRAFGGSGILKTRRLGYDGKGQTRLVDASAEMLRQACHDAAGAPLILEALVDFSAEISIIAARGHDGTLAAYDPAENRHRDGILRSSAVPAAIDGEIARLAERQAFTILEALDYVGVVGVEFFLARDGRLLVNEIAPRVHNSGHWTEAACLVSQFEQHVRAICGLPLGPTWRHCDCVMENLIGEDVLGAAGLLRDSDVLLHLYGKAEIRPGRKMGHFTRLRRGARGG